MGDTAPKESQRMVDAAPSPRAQTLATQAHEVRDHRGTVRAETEVSTHQRHASLCHSLEEGGLQVKRRTRRSMGEGRGQGDEQGGRETLAPRVARLRHVSTPDSALGLRGLCSYSAIPVSRPTPDPNSARCHRSCAATFALRPKHSSTSTLLDSLISFASPSSAAAGLLPPSTDCGI